MAKELGVKKLEVGMNSYWMTSNILQNHNASNRDAAQYMREVKSITYNFTKLIIEQIAWENNEEADTLRKITHVHPSHLENHVMIKVLQHKTIEAPGKQPIKGPNTAIDIIDDAGHAHRRAHQFRIQGDTLYQIFPPQLLPQHLNSTKANNIIKKVHTELCGSINRVRMIVAEVLRCGFYWPTMHQDSLSAFQRFEYCFSQ